MNEYDCIDKWRLNELNKIVDSIDEDIYNEILENKIQYAIDYINIILRVMGSSIICMREIICLSSCGYPDGCMALARLLCEHAVILYFLDSSKNAPDFSQIIENYYNDSEIKRTKTLLFTAEKAENEDKMNELKYKLENFTSAIPTYNRKNKSDYWWANINSFADMFIEVIKRNQEIDGKNDFLLSLYIDYINDQNRDKIIKFGEQNAKKRLLEYKKSNPGKIGRNSLCPCGSGKKYKKCCGA